MTYRHNWGEDRVFYHDDEGRLNSVPVGWTSLGPDDPFVLISAGKSAFRTVDLLEMAAVLEDLRRARGNE